MDHIIQSYFEKLEAKDKQDQYEAYQMILAATEEKVDWVYEIWEGLKSLYDELGDEDIKQKALLLIELEDESKYRKKYAGVWKKN
ncbi:hypothetical protein [Halobacillus seohaensis]|uniref:IDEAL domain-containing protein n=1 Tax=Halobacillus seohaensis TaxID=447421 RepID=A0ABW2EUT3_9BACI